MGINMISEKKSRYNERVFKSLGDGATCVSENLRVAENPDGRAVAPGGLFTPFETETFLELLEEELIAGFEENIHGLM